MTFHDIFFSATLPGATNKERQNYKELGRRLAPCNFGIPFVGCTRQCRAKKGVEDKGFLERLRLTPAASPTILRTSPHVFDRFSRGKKATVRTPRYPTVV